MMLVFELWHRNFLERTAREPLPGSSLCLQAPIYGPRPVSSALGDRSE